MSNIQQAFDIAALQLDSFHDKKIDSYWSVCHAENVAFLLLGEYVLNPFFKEIEQLSLGVLEEQSHFVLGNLLEMSKRYETRLIAPFVRFVGKKPYKSLALFYRGCVQYHHAQRLLSFEHWNEKGFFANSTPKNPKMPLCFEFNGCRVAVLFGFETYFDAIWLRLKKIHIDVVLVASVSTFNSTKKWRELLKIRAFLNHCYLLRANRIGRYVPENEKYDWEFYGDSFFVSPSGDLESCLSQQEELLIGKIEPEIIQECKTLWDF